MFLPGLLYGQVDAAFDARTGNYQIVDAHSGWRLAGTIGKAATVTTSQGQDGRGVYRELRFDWTEGVTPLKGAIRTYTAAPAVLFRLEYPEGCKGATTTFPNFKSIPKGLHPFSYRDTQFAPFTFSLNQTSTPWLLFDDKAQAMVMSPADNFLNAKMVGTEDSFLGMKLNDRLAAAPKGYRQDCLITFGDRIGTAWQTWGETLRSLYGRQPAKPDAITEKLGYWTDNGADYYYNFERDKGYPGTMLALKDRYRDAGTPLGYLQLDSWWYRKLSDGISGDKNPDRKNPAFPADDWNRYGGVLEYRASPELFPKGLDGFYRDLALPIIVHGRWIDKGSPLRQRYEVIGVAPVDQRYWHDVASYLASSGVICYEQDWLDHIYEATPEMSSVAGVTDRMMDGMAAAMAAKGLSMQYCMAPPRFMMQGVKYPNLATVRTSIDRFEPKRWERFVFGAPLVDGVGALPWSDVFKSRETGNLILSLLSAGPVGTGDAIGKEDATNLKKAARPDSMLVKPDRPLMPTDETYLNEARHNDAPFVGSTFTDHGGYRTQYLFAFPRSKDKQPATLKVGPAYLYDFVTATGTLVNGSVKAKLGPDGYGYWLAAPVSKAGVALLGDLGKWVPTGKQRIASIVDGLAGLKVRIVGAAGEGPVTLEGYSAKPVRASSGSVRWDAKTKRFSVSVASNGDVTLDAR